MYLLLCCKNKDVFYFVFVYIRIKGYYVIVILYFVNNLLLVNLEMINYFEIFYFRCCLCGLYFCCRYKCNVGECVYK